MGRSAMRKRRFRWSHGAAAVFLVVVLAAVIGVVVDHIESISGLQSSTPDSLGFGCTGQSAAPVAFLRWRRSGVTIVGSLTRPVGPPLHFHGGYASDDISFRLLHASWHASIGDDRLKLAGPANRVTSMQPASMSCPLETLAQWRRGVPEDEARALRRDAEGLPTCKQLAIPVPSYSSPSAGGKAVVVGFGKKAINFPTMELLEDDGPASCAGQLSWGLEPDIVDVTLDTSLSGEQEAALAESEAEYLSRTGLFRSVTQSPESVTR